MGYYDDGGNAMTARDWDEVDKSSRQLLSCLLETQLSAEAVGESHGCCCWDLSCVIRGKKIAVEIKERRMDHDRFGDILVETSKQECIANKQFDTALAANVFKDQVVCLANLFDKDAKHFRRPAPTTTQVKGALHTYIVKDFTGLPQKIKFKFKRDTSSRWVFSKTK